MKNKDKVGVRGFFRLQIEEDGKIVGDSKWRENQVVNNGIRDFLVDHIIGDSDNAQSITHLALGTGSAPASNGTDLEGEIEDASNSRKAVTTSIVGSRTAQFTGQFASSDEFVSEAHNISNVGLFNSSETSAGSLFAGNTYTSSSLNTNQNVNVTWKITRQLLATVVSKFRKFMGNLSEIIMSQAQFGKVQRLETELPL